MNALRYFLKLVVTITAVAYAVLFLIAYFVHTHTLPTGCVPVGDGYQRCTYEIR